MKFLYLLLFVFSAAFCFGQKAPKPTKKYNTYFYNNEHERVRSLDSADFIQFVIEPDKGSSLYNVEEYYKNNTQRFVGKSSRISPVMLQDQGMSFYPNGHKKQVAQYLNGQITGTVYQFYPNGQLYMVKEYIADKKDLAKHGGYAIKDSSITAVYDSTGKSMAEDGNGHYVRYDDDFKNIEEEGALKGGKPDGKWKGKDILRHIGFEEDYASGKLIKGSATDSAGINYTYEKRSVAAEFPGGIDALGQYIGHNLRYPPASRERGMQGTVVINFVINTDGTISKIKFLNRVDNDIDNEALRVIKSMPKWAPGIAYGKTVAFKYTIPISFTLQ
ncbi:energy transducer TonB [Mucilaginibacter jinjuensis]|uniref:TonB family protein n=1 Tax=Mucilaginibacter jinjuensis TaxID=1176721 RepID=A0ABY7TBM6_9SPHI|nr:energy transducer TonB [Mucilaginibacter jinjuensis]WCT12622.1 TonB family protein [Mucilaginibacter jinjuensis]